LAHHRASFNSSKNRRQLFPSTSGCCALFLVETLARFVP
jgi:hypothetical protein